MNEIPTPDELKAVISAEVRRAAQPVIEALVLLLASTRRTGFDWNELPLPTDKPDLSIRVQTYVVAAFRAKGWEVKENSDHQGSFVYFQERSYL